MCLIRVVVVNEENTMNRNKSKTKSIRTWRTRTKKTLGKIKAYKKQSLLGKDTKQ